MIYGIIVIAFALLYVQFPADGELGPGAAESPLAQAAPRGESGCVAPGCSGSRPETADVSEQSSGAKGSDPIEPGSRSMWKHRSTLDRLALTNELLMLGGLRDFPVREVERPEPVTKDRDAGSRAPGVCTGAPADFAARLSIYNLGLTGEMPKLRRQRI